MFLFLSRLSFALPCWLFSVVTHYLRVWSVSPYPTRSPSLRRWTGLSEWHPRSRRTSWPSKGWRNTRTRRRRPSGLWRRRSPRRTGRTKEGSSSRTTRPDTGWRLLHSCSNAGAKKIKYLYNILIYEISILGCNNWISTLLHLFQRGTWFGFEESFFRNRRRPKGRNSRTNRSRKIFADTRAFQARWTCWRIHHRKC